jgi:hypothetical protein
MKIEINSTVDTDEIKYALQKDLSTKQLVKFVIDLGDKLNKEDEYYQLLQKEFSQIKVLLI